MALSWKDAMKKYFAMHGKKFHIPRKGTEEYEAIKKLQGEHSASETKVEEVKEVKEVKEMKEKKPRKPRAKKAEKVEMSKKEFVKEHKTLVEELKEGKPAELAKEAKKQEKELAKVEKAKKPRKPRAKKADMASVSSGSTTEEKPKRGRKARKTHFKITSSEPTHEDKSLLGGGSKKAPEVQVEGTPSAPEGSQRINSTGLTAQERVFDQLTEQQSGLGIPQGNLPGLEKAIISAIKPVAGVKKEKKVKATDKTVLEKKTSDPLAVDGHAPFSFNALKQRLFIN